MRTLVMLVFVAVGYIQFNSAARGKINKKRFCCPSEWTRYGNSCYWVGYEERLTFHQAVAYCTKLEAHLVRIENSEENTFLKNLLRKTKASSTWTSLNDQSHEGIWRWYGTGKQADFSDWAPSEPTNWRGSEHCVDFWGIRQYKWNDDRCTVKLIPLCEKPIGKQ